MEWIIPFNSIDKLSVYANFAHELSTLSKCTKRKVAALLIDNNGQRILSMGINGGPAGGLDCLCAVSNSKYSCVHAEANALAKCTLPLNDATLLCTLSPCITCAALIINSGIKRVIYLEEWKNLDGVKLLREHDIDVVYFRREDKLICR